ncbi:MAG: DUF3859 domain-containing protein [Planctomycetota bacterium]
MAKKQPEARMVSYGLYTPFDRESEQLPQILEFTDHVPAREGVEFGYILEIRKARGKVLTFRIDHPPFPDKSGETAPPFEGEQRIRAPEWHFFLGDTIWPPVEDKVGDWTLSTWVDGDQVASRTFHVVLNEEQ